MVDRELLIGRVVGNLETGTVLYAFSGYQSARIAPIDPLATQVILSVQQERFLTPLQTCGVRYTLFTNTMFDNPWLRRRYPVGVLLRERPYAEAYKDRSE